MLGIGDGELGVGGGEVGVETSGEGFGFIGFRGEPVGFFLRVGGDVIEFLVMVLVEADEPPAVFEDGAVGGGTAGVVVRVVPAERAGGQGFAAEGWAEVGPVDWGWERGAGGGGDGDAEVHGDDWFVGGGSGFGEAGPVDDERDADPAFPWRAFAGAETEVGGDRVFGAAEETAVVGGEDEDSAVGEIEIADGGAETADAIVDAGDHGGVDRVIVRVGGIGEGLVFCDDVGFAAEGSVDGVLGEVDEERTVAGGLDEADGVGGEAFGEEFAVGAVFEGWVAVGGEPFFGLAAVVAAEVEGEAVGER